MVTLQIHRAAPEPVELLVERDHAYQRKPDRREGDRAVRGKGCRVCGAGKYAPRHLGAPPSLNEGGSGMDRMAFQSLKKAWQAAFTEALEDADLPRGLAGVQVEGQVGFHDRRARDEGNHRWMIEKALGDALVAGGWLPDDTFYPVRRYSFGNLEGVYMPGRSFTRLLLFPRPE